MQLTWQAELREILDMCNVKDHVLYQELMDLIEAEKQLSYQEGLCDADES